MGARCREQVIQEREYLKTKRVNEIELNRDFALRQKVVHIHLEFTTGAAASGALKHGGVLAMIKQIQIVLNTNDILRGYTGNQKYITDYYETRQLGAKSAEAAIAANGRMVWDYYFTIDFARNRFDLSDFSAILPLQNAASAYLGIQLSTPEDIFVNGDGVTMDADNSYVDQIDKIVYESGRGENITLADAISNSTKIYEASSTPKLIENETKSFEIDEKQDYYRPANALILANYFFTHTDAKGSNPVPSDNVVNYLRLRNTLTARSLFTTIWQTKRAIQRLENQMSAQPTGVLQLDLLDELQGGIVNDNPDALKLITLNAAPAAGQVNSIATWARYIRGG